MGKQFIDDEAESGESEEESSEDEVATPSKKSGRSRLIEYDEDDSEAEPPQLIKRKSGKPKPIL